LLLVSSRETKRWVIPKGWQSSHLSDADAAAREAEQEAGIVGDIMTPAVGAFGYMKRDIAGLRRVTVDVFILLVRLERDKWLEQHERQRQWFALDVAARKVREPKLSLILGQLGQAEFWAVDGRGNDPEATKLLKKISLM
jgi:uncharacterized protein